MSAAQVAPSRILRKLAAYLRQNDLAAALREVGRIERTLFIIEWILDAGMQRRTQVGLNKGEAHHALKNALRIGRQGEIRDRTTEGQHYRIAGLNLLTAIIVYWNTLHLGHGILLGQQRRLPNAPIIEGIPMIHDKVITITGAASGIGAAAACLFARNGAKLVLADRL
jgi:TnpA family transposase